MSVTVRVALFLFGDCSLVQDSGDQMNSMTDKANGVANETIGNVKQGAGKLVGSDKLEAEGVAQEAKGAVQKATGEAKAAVEAGADKVADAIKKSR